LLAYEGHSILLVGDLLGYGGDQFLLLANNDNSSLSDFLIIDGKSLVSQSGRMGEQPSTSFFFASK
jgi:hypothetical protein